MFYRNKELMMTLEIKNFYRKWCLICKFQTRIVKKLQKNFDKIQFNHVNIKKNEKQAKKYDIKSVPAILILQNDKILHKLEGFSNKKKIKSHIKSALKK